MDSLCVDLSWPILSTIIIILGIIGRIPCHFRNILCHFRHFGDAIWLLLRNWTFHYLWYLRAEMTSGIGYQNVSSTHAVLDASSIQLRVTKELPQGRRLGFAWCHFRQISCHFRHFGRIGDFLRDSLALIQEQYKRTPWVLKALYGQLMPVQFLLFLQWVDPKPHKHISLKPLNPLLLKLYIFNFQYPNLFNWKL